MFAGKHALVFKGTLAGHIVVALSPAYVPLIALEFWNFSE